MTICQMSVTCWQQIQRTHWTAIMYVHGRWTRTVTSAVLIYLSSNSGIYTCIMLMYVLFKVLPQYYTLFISWSYLWYYRYCMVKGLKIKSTWCHSQNKNVCLSACAQLSSHTACYHVNIHVHQGDMYFYSSVTALKIVIHTFLSLTK